MGDTATGSRRPNRPIGHRRVVAIALVIGDDSAHAIARHSGIRLADVSEALETARREGLIPTSDATASGVTIADELRPDEVADLHESVARQLMAEGPDRLPQALAHARSALSLRPSDEMLSLVEYSARTSLSVSDYSSARLLLEFAEEFGYLDNSTGHAKRLILLAEALEGLGLVLEARTAAARAFDLAELASDADLACDAAIRYALPVDWYAGDPRAASLLQRAEALEPPANRLPALAAARALVEMRIPTGLLDGQQMSWITRASVAQPFADRSIQDSTGFSDVDRMLPLLAWRSTHRAPRHLARRREVSRAALDMAQRLRQPTRQVEAATMLAVDALESGDRTRFDEALGVARWIAQRDGNPRLLWHSSAMAASAALMARNIDEAERLRAEASAHGRSINTSSWLTAEMLLLAQLVFVRDDPDEMNTYLVDDDSPWVGHVIGRLAVGYVHARVGDPAVAEHHVEVALRQMDEETSILLAGTLAAQIVAMTGMASLIEPVLGLLVPWSDHVAVDANAWWCNGPVSLAIAELHAARGDLAGAGEMLRAAQPIAQTMGCFRARQRLDRLHGSLGFGDADDGVQSLLTRRERVVLDMIASGQTNSEIAAKLSFSTSTIRNDTSAIYRKLGVTGRAEAVAKAIALGIVGLQRTEIISNS